MNAFAVAEAFIVAFQRQICRNIFYQSSTPAILTILSFLHINAQSDGMGSLPDSGNGVTVVQGQS